ncbi:zinc ribbon domain-containing protein [Streptomyces canus]
MGTCDRRAERRCCHPADRDDQHALEGPRCPTCRQPHFPPAASR